jgi:basic membrane protein A and related proteins
LSMYLRTLAVVGVLGLGLAACGSPPPETEPTETSTSNASADPEAKNFKACMVSDSGGFDDKSFNQTSYKGLSDAVKELGISESKLESKSDNEYPTNINTLISQKCNIIVTVGFKLGDATYAAAKDNPDIDFAIVDYEYADAAKNPPLPNLQGLVFNTAQPAFLAGYLAAGMTKSGKVGTFGGINIPTVSIFMDGFAEGVAYYNQQKSKNVQVLGWNDATQKGVFTNDFEDKTLGRTKANDLISQGADIVLPVAGPAGLGALEAANSSGGKVTAIWVDTDGCVSAAEYCGSLISSVEKGMDVAVTQAITDSFQDKFSNKTYVGTLDNGGVSLAPYHEFDSKVPADLKAEIDDLKTKLASGEVPIKSKVQPVSK